MEILYGIINFFSELSISTVVLVITVSVLLHYLFFSNGYNPPLPPSPFVKLPLIGHLYLLGHDMRKPLRKFHKKLGDVYSLYFGGRLAIVISGYETMKDAFLKNGEVFADRPSLYMTDIATKKRGFALANGQRWKEHRRFALSTMKDFGMGKSKLEGKVHQEVKTFLAEIDAFKGEAFDPKDLISTHVANIICSILFKGQFRHDDPRWLGMVRMIEENVVSSAGLANLMPWLAEFPGDPLNCKRMISNADKIFEYVEEIIDEHVKDLDENNIDDLTSAYIHEVRRLEMLNQETTMNLAELSGLIGDLFIAGSHTTAAALGWALVCLVEFPDVQEKLYKDVSKQIGEQRLPSLADKVSLPYLEAFYLEVLRFCNITIVLGVHATSRDLTFHGFTIPKEALIMPDLDSVLNDPEIWGDPENFRPERFIDEDGSFKKYDEMLSFFLGKRSCVGESLARTELFIFIGALVQRYRLTAPPNETLTVQGVDGVFGLTHAPKRFKLIAEPR